MIAENGTTEEVQERVSEAADELRARVEALAEQSQIDLADVQEQIQELRQQFVARADTAKGRIAAELQHAAARIWDDLEGLEDDRVKQRAADLARELDRSAGYLQEHTLEEMGQDVTESAQENVWQALGIAFLLGFLLGLVVGSSRR
ncbi:MAG: hypothetical protein JXN59_01120 [Anaerolineae bacterium]|nr:hypothetical protein [Anaerolineae bacterium]